MSRRQGVAAVVLGLACLFAARNADACYSCASGLCADGLVRTFCMETYANGKTYCTLSGNACTAGGGGGHEGGLVAGDKQMAWVVFLSASESDISSLLPTGHDRVESEIPGESPSDLLARVSGRSADGFAVSGTVIIYGGDIAAVRTSYGDAIKIRVVSSRGASADRSSAGGSGVSIVIDSSMRSDQLLISRVRLSGQSYIAVAGVQTYASAETRRIERQELIQGIDRSQQGVTLGLTAD